MKLKVHLAPVGAGVSVEDAVDVYCGEGQQILRWLGHAACARLAHKRGDVLGSYVPQAVLDKGGQVLDVDIVLNEVFGDGDDVHVEYANGPAAYQVRWEGRPRTPPFQWDGDAEVVPPHDAWLRELDLRQEGLAALLEPDLVAQDPSTANADLERTKDLIIQHAGGLQMMFWCYTCEGGAGSPDQICRMTLPQFRALMQAGKVITGQYPPERIDELYTAIATSEITLNRKAEGGKGVSWFNFTDFLVALVHVGQQRFAAESFAGAAPSPLSTKLLSLLQQSFMAHVYPDMQRRVEKLQAGLTPSAGALLRKSRRLTEQTLERCQLKRVRAAQVTVDLRYICKHLQQWNLLGNYFSLHDIATIAVFAKQSATDPEQYNLQPMPLACNYDEFERLLLGISWLTYTLRKKHDPFEDFLAEMLELVYRKAGVLVAAPKPAEPQHEEDLDQP